MDPVMLVLRLFHIVAGVLWVGSAFLFTGFIGPSAAEVAPTAGPLLSVAVKKRRVARVISWLSITTVIAGWLIWLRYVLSMGSAMDFIGTPFGLVLTIGGILATIAAYVGITGIGRNVERLVDLGDTIAASGGPPTAEQAAQLQHLGSELERHGKVDLVLLLLAVAAMATARYW